ncbi:hypothetical protein L6452_20140 [Arctium lappa]|uniref:Uncharacterized protein n=1 Tax=Arctium lappa TaxID=4217 RepID=A0ACB9BEY0_ARCLA|nr:hypothetical protein L6452_20140 [Arctium lappa]
MSSPWIPHLRIHRRGHLPPSFPHKTSPQVWCKKKKEYDGLVFPTGLDYRDLGDKRAKKGKIFKGSYGNSRPKKEKKIQHIKDKVEVPRSTPWPLPFKLI